MQNRFGLKDFVLMVLVIVVGVIAFLAMYRADRQHEQIQQIDSNMQTARDQIQTMRRQFEEEQQANREILRETLQAEVALLRDQIDRLGESGSGLSVAEGTDPVVALHPWARPGVEVTEPKRYTWPSDPTQVEGFQVGGEFVEIFEAQPPKITPYFYTDVYGRRIVDGTVNESLGRYDPVTLQMVGLLGEAWQLDPEGMWLRVKIDDRARFSDGEPVTADDFKFTFDEIIFNPEHDTARFQSTLNVIDEVRVIDEKVVEFAFVKPQFTNKSAALGMYVLPKHYYEQFTATQMNEATGLLMGSGPYKLDALDPEDQWTQGSDIVLVRNDNYWGEQPPIARLRYTVRQDAVPRLATFENGEGHMMRPTPDQFTQKTREPNFMEESYALDWANMRSGFAFIAWNTGERNGRLTPFHDTRVRRAMTMLIDREGIVRDVYQGLAEVATSPFAVGSDQVNPAIEPLPHDPERAAELLADAGWIDRDNDGWLENEAGQEFEFEYLRSTLTSPTSRLLWARLKQGWEEAGIRPVLRAVDWSVMKESVDSRDYDAVTFAWSASSPESDPYQLWHSDSIANAGDNFSQWRNDEKDRLIEQGRATLDYDERMTIWHELHRVMHEEQPYTFLLNPKWLRFISRDVGNVQAYPIGLDINEMFMFD